MSFLALEEGGGILFVSSAVLSDHFALGKHP